MRYSTKLKEEINFCNSEDFILGDYLYMAIAINSTGTYKMPISTAYKIDYAIKKAFENIKHINPNFTIAYINKVFVGDVEHIDRFYAGKDFELL